VTTTHVTTEKLDIGKVIQKTLRAIRRNIFIFAVLAIFCTAIPFFLRLSLRNFLTIGGNTWLLLSIIWMANLVVHVVIQAAQCT